VGGGAGGSGGGAGTGSAVGSGVGADVGAGLGAGVGAGGAGLGLAGAAASTSWTGPGLLGCEADSAANQSPFAKAPAATIRTEIAAQALIRLPVVGRRRGVSPDINLLC